MVQELTSLGMLFLGMAIGSVSPLGIWGFLAFVIIATFFIMWNELSSNKRRERKNVP